MSKREVSKELVRYSYKGPGHGRKSFTIYTDIKSPDGQREYQTVSDDRVKAINKDNVEKAASRS